MCKVTKDYNSVDWNSLFYYDNNSPTGLSWKVDRLSGKGMKVYAARKGDFAGYIQVNKKKDNKYATVLHAGKIWLAHRVIWVMKYGYVDPEKVIDHIDCNSLNNDISNLREVKQKLNVRNSPKHKDNTWESGVQFYYSGKPNQSTYAVATWRCVTTDRRCNKKFSVKKLGLLPAFKAAVEYRRKMIEELNAQGAGYTENHGK